MWITFAELATSMIRWWPRWTIGVTVVRMYARWLGKGCGWWGLGGIRIRGGSDEHVGEGGGRGDDRW